MVSASIVLFRRRPRAFAPAGGCAAAGARSRLIRRLLLVAAGLTGSAVFAAEVVATAGAAAGAAAAVTPSPAGSLAELQVRFAALERRISQLETENDAWRRQHAADRARLDRLASPPPAPAPPPAAPASLVTFSGRETRLAIAGLVHLLAESGGAPDSRYTGIGDRFLLRRMRLAVAGSFAEPVSFKVESDFGNAAIAGASGYRGQLTDAFVAWTGRPALKLQLGQFKTPFGYDQLVSDSRTLFVERALANDRLTLGRQIGAMASGQLWGRVLHYSLGVFNGNGVNTGANDNSKFLHAGRLVATVVDARPGASVPVRWNLAGNFFNTVDQGTFTGRRTGYGLDTQVLAGPAEVGFEWLRNENHPVRGASVTGEGWYAYGAYLLSPRWQVLLRYDTHDPATARAATTTREWTYGLNYLLGGEDLKLSLNYVCGRQPAPLPEGRRFLGRVQVAF